MEPKKGIDVSKFQKAIDWVKVKNAVDFAIIRIGYRGYGTGGLVLDPYYNNNIAGAKAAGLPVGLYFFSQAMNAAEGEAEAEFVAAHCTIAALAYPVFFDSETGHYNAAIGKNDGRADGISKADRTAAALAFCAKITQLGGKAGVYASTSWFGSHLDMPQLAAYDVWVADYRGYCGYKADNVTMWQHSSKGAVPGVSTNVDVNECYKNYAPAESNTPAQAPAAPPLLFIMESESGKRTISVSQGCGVAVDGVAAATYSHAGTHAYDINGGDTGKDYLIAPVALTCLRVYNGQTATSKCNFAWFITDAAVACADGYVGKMIMLCAHCDAADMAALGIKAGAKFAKGQRFYREGTAGKATGNHVHIMLGRAPFSGTGWFRAATGNWDINNPVFLHKAAYLAADCTTRNAGGYQWQKYNGTVTTTPAATAPTTPAATAMAAGQKVKLTGKLYTSSTGTAGNTKNGVAYWLYDGKLVNGRYRLTNSSTRVGKAPIGANVSGWADSSALATM